MSKTLIRVSCFAPTYFRGHLLDDTVKFFLDQDLSLKETPLANDLEIVGATLYILDDGQMLVENFDIYRRLTQKTSKNVVLIDASKRFPTLPSKYLHLLNVASIDHERKNRDLKYFKNKQPIPESDHFVFIWDTDDIYLPQHISHTIGKLYPKRKSAWFPVVSPPGGIVHLPGYGSAKPSRILTDYPDGVLKYEYNTSGRFHGSLCLTLECLLKEHRWLDTKDNTFDMDFINQLQQKELLTEIDPPLVPTYGFRFSASELGMHYQHYCGNSEHTAYEQIGMDYLVGTESSKNPNNSNTWRCTSSYNAFTLNQLILYYNTCRNSIGEEYSPLLIPYFPKEVVEISNILDNDNPE